MVGERIRQARMARGLTLEELANKTGGITRQAISKYELGKDVPSSSVMLRLAKALDLRIEYFHRGTSAYLSSISYKKHNDLPTKELLAIQGRVQDWLERYVEIETIISPPDGLPTAKLPSGRCYHISDQQDTEQAADCLRKAWKLGTDPVESVCDVLEDNGVVVIQIDADPRFDELACWSGARPVVALRRGAPGTAQRRHALHGLAHLLLDIAPDVNEECACNRFAEAFLVPAQAAKRELGDSRRGLNIRELLLLEAEYGLDPRDWANRAHDLAIIDKTTHKRVVAEAKLCDRRKSGSSREIPEEHPRRYERLVYRALAEGLVSEARAAAYLGKPLMQFVREQASLREAGPAAPSR